MMHLEVPHQAGVGAQPSRMGIWEAGERVRGLTWLDLLWRHQCIPSGAWHQGKGPRDGQGQLLARSQHLVLTEV